MHGQQNVNPPLPNKYTNLKLTRIIMRTEHALELFYVLLTVHRGMILGK